MERLTSCGNRRRCQHIEKGVGRVGRVSVVRHTPVPANQLSPFRLANTAEYQRAIAANDKSATAAGIQLSGSAVSQPIPWDHWPSAWIWRGNTTQDMFACKQVVRINCCILRRHFQPGTTYGNNDSINRFTAINRNVIFIVCSKAERVSLIYRTVPWTKNNGKKLKKNKSKNSEIPNSVRKLWSQSDQLVLAGIAS